MDRHAASQYYGEDGWRRVGSGGGRGQGTTPPGPPPAQTQASYQPPPPLVAPTQPMPEVRGYDIDGTQPIFAQHNMNLEHS